MSDAPERIPTSRYTSPEFLRLELDRVFRRTWQLAGPASDLDQVGAYFTFEIGDESILVVRQPDGVRAFHNVCRHRGRSLREPGIGHARSFRCPFHHWEYGIDGRLQRIPERELFPPCAKEGELDLAPVAADQWAGYVWVNLAPNPEPLREFLAPVIERIEPYGLEELAIFEDLSIELECNWKVAADAFNEAYHLRAVHPQLLQVLDETQAVLEELGPHFFIRVPFGTPSPSYHDRESVNEGLKHLLREAGIDPAKFSGGAADVRAAIVKALRARQDLDLARITDEQLTSNDYLFVFPNLSFNLYALRHMLLRYRPHPTDPNRMFMDQLQLQRVPRGAKRPPRPKPQRFRYGEGSLGSVADQDTFNFLRVQRGMRGSGIESLYLGEAERAIRHMHREIERYVARP